MKSLLLVLCASPAGAAFLDLGAGARAPGMGDAFVAVADDVYATHYNPAGLTQLERPELGTSYTKLLMGLSDGSDLGMMYLGYAHPLKKGTVAGSWEQFTLDSGLYQEQAFALSYARLLEGGRASLGGSAKYLRRSFGSFPEAGNAMNGLAATGRPDPVLSGNSSVGAFDADLGLLYRLGPSCRLGLALTHVPQPDVAFSSADSDKVPLGVSGGVAYRSTLTNAQFQYETRRAPTGARDHVAVLAAERWFPALFVGDFGLRGSLRAGSREQRAVSFGASVRTGRITMDYGFSLPLGSIADTAGTHRVALSLRFGKPAEPDESVLMILEAMKRLKRGAAPDPHILAKGLPPEAGVLLREHLAASDALLAQGEYRAAAERYGMALALSPADAELLKRYGRLNWVVQQLPRLPDVRTEPVAAAWHRSILRYVDGDAGAALESAAEALSLRPGFPALEDYLSQLASITGLPRPAQAPDGARRYRVAAFLSKAAAAAEASRYDEAIPLARSALAESPENADALEFLGLSLFAVGDYAGALEAWRKAAQTAPDERRRKQALHHVTVLERLMTRKRTPPPPAPQAAVSTPAPAPAAPSASPARLQALYDSGIDHYTSGRLGEARAAFAEVLRLDPAYTPAAKALKRVRADMEGRR